MTLEAWAGLAVIIAIAALLGGMAGGWMGRRRGSAGTESLRNLPTLVDQSGKTRRSAVASVLWNIPRVLTTVAARSSGRGKYLPLAVRKKCS